MGKKKETKAIGDMINLDFTLQDTQAKKALECSEKYQNDHALQSTVLKLKRLINAYKNALALYGQNPSSDTLKRTSNIRSQITELADEILIKVTEHEMENKNKETEWWRFVLNLAIPSSVAIVAAFITVKCSSNDLDTRVQKLEEKLNYPSPTPAQPSSAFVLNSSKHSKGE